MTFQYEFIENQSEIVEPVTLEEMKAYMRVDLDYSADDDIISNFITASRERLELYLNVGLVEHRVKLQWYGNAINLPFSPSSKTFLVIKNVSDNILLTESEYVIRGLKELSLYVKSSSCVGSFFYGENGEVSVWNGGFSGLNELYDVEYTTGYATADKLPKALKNAIMADVDYMYKNQGSAEIKNIAPMAIQLAQGYSKNLVIQ